MKGNRSSRKATVAFDCGMGIVALAICLGASPLSAGQGQQRGPATRLQYPPAQSDSGAEPQGAPPQNHSVPPTLTLPVGTLVTVRVQEFLSSDRNQPGDGFTTVLEQPLVADGWVVSRRGETVMGRIVTAQKAGRVRGVSELGVELSELVLADGRQVPIRTQLLENSGGTSRGRDAAGIGTTSGLGAAIGAAAGGGRGAGIGAAAGAAAGVAGVLVTRGRPTVIPPETQLTFRLEAPLTVSTEGREQAFQPVTQQDYERDTLRRRSRPYAFVPPYPPPPYYWGYYGPGPYYYRPAFYPPPFVFGFYRFRGPRFFRRGWR